MAGLSYLSDRTLDTAVVWSESIERSATIDELRIPVRTHWVKDAPSGIGIGIGVDIGNRISMYDSDRDSDADICADEEFDCSF